MTKEKISELRQALLDNAAGGQLHTVHRNELFKLLDEAEAASDLVSVPIVEAVAVDEPQAEDGPKRRRRKIEVE